MSIWRLPEWGWQGSQSATPGGGHSAPTVGPRLVIAVHGAVPKQEKCVWWFDGGRPRPRSPTTVVQQ